MVPAAAGLDVDDGASGVGVFVDHLESGFGLNEDGDQLA